MRQFLVLGFSSNSASESGQCLYLGTDRGEALRVVNGPGKEVRRELYDLAHPHLRRNFAPEVGEQVVAPDADDPDAEDPDAEAPNVDVPVGKSGKVKK